MAATRPIPGSLTNNLALSSDGKYLIASYPTFGLGGSSYVFDVEQMIKAIENPGNYKLDARDRGVDTWGFQASNQRNVTISTLLSVLRPTTKLSKEIGLITLVLVSRMVRNALPLVSVEILKVWRSLLLKIGWN
ncbi:hypothetical protein [Microcoleus sp. PH2017_38_RDM_U_B]|uniref:hypothetical protein n=1 Tax=Microcoleus sp. PH2017_38_RDM_U_B TaxID=2798848 RepID=UPI001DD1F69B|nr:hypothetical protein [Microcoleus sp. PH2017_38_RDM_U_B]MCC3620080.1 hypothetical protein [Microcoleus sp. PH2017_38_RDM_U_B]